MVSLGPWLEPLAVSMPLLDLTALLPQVSEVEVKNPTAPGTGVSLGNGHIPSSVLQPLCPALSKSPCGMSGLILKQRHSLPQYPWGPEHLVVLSRRSLCPLLGGYRICSPA